MTIPMEEEYVSVPGGQIWYKVVGKSRKIPLLILHGGPGSPHNYLTPLENLASDRPVIFYDQLGCGKSDRPKDPTLWQTKRFVKEIEVVRKSLSLEQLHILGHSWGSILAVEYAITQPTGLKSLILASPCLNLTRYLEDVNTFRKQLPIEIQKVLDQNEAAQTTDSEEYQKAVMAFYKRHMCRLDPWPEAINLTAAGLGLEVYHTMWGPNEFFITGNLANYDCSNRLHEITIPTYFTCGLFDLATPNTTAGYQRIIKGSILTIFKQSSHMPNLEEPVSYLNAVQQFLNKIEE